MPILFSYGSHLDLSWRLILISCRCSSIDYSENSNKISRVVHEIYCKTYRGAHKHKGLAITSAGCRKKKRGGSQMRKLWRACLRCNNEWTICDIFVNWLHTCQFPLPKRVLNGIIQPQVFSDKRRLKCRGKTWLSLNCTWGAVDWLFLPQFSQDFLIWFSKASTPSPHWTSGIA